MPLQDWNQRATFDAAYDIGLGRKLPHWPAEPRLNYNRAALLSRGQELAEAYASVFSIISTDTVVIVGSGFAWSAEALVALTGCEAIGVDTSTWIQNTKDAPEEDDWDAALTAAGVPVDEHDAIKAELTDRAGGPGNRARATISEEDLRTKGSQNKVKKLFTKELVDVVITEDLLSMFTDTEISDAVANVDDLLDGVRAGHLVTTSETGDTSVAGYNWKSLAEWRAFLDGLGWTNHVLIEVGTFRTG